MTGTTRESIGFQQIGILLTGLMLVIYGAVGLWSESFSQNFRILLLVAAIAVVGALFVRMMN